MSRLFLRKLSYHHLPGWLVFLSTSIVLLAGSWSPDLSIGGDAAVYLYEAYRTLQGDPLVWRGYFSSNPMGHPAPVLHLVLAAGAALAQLMGFDFTVGSAIAYLLVLSACVGVSVQMMYRGSGNNPAVAAVSAASILWLLTRTPASEIYAVRTALTFLPMYGPSFSAILALPALAAAYAVCNGRRQCAWAAVLFGALTIQASSSGAPLGVLSLVVGAWAALSGRFWSKYPLRSLAVLLVGFGPFVVRMYTDGWLFPYDYAKATINARNIRASLYTPESFYVRLNQILGSTGRPAVVLAAMFVLIFAGLLIRRTRPGGIFLMTALILQTSVSIWFTTVAHQTVHLGALLPMSSAAAATLLLTPPRFTGFLKKLASFAVAASTAGFICLGLVYQSNLAGGDKMELSYEQIQDDWTRDLITALSADPDIGLLGLTAEKNPILDIAIGWVPASELYLSLSRSGINFCAQPNTNIKLNGTPPSCAGRTPDRWLVFDTSMRPETKYLKVLQENPNISLPQTFIHLSDNLSEIGYMYCEGDGSYWMARQDPTPPGCT